MKPGKRFLSSLLAAAISFSSANTVLMTAAYAAEDDEKKPELTFDGEYELDDSVSYYTYFDTANSKEVQENLEKRLLSAMGKRDIRDITFRDLLRPTTLNLSGLELEDLPACMNYMTNLRTLNLSNNRLRNDGLSALNMIGCTKLTNINLSKNYLTRVPSWFINSRVTTRNISENFLTGENPRSIKALTDEYYYVNGEPFDESSLKTRILDSIRFNDNSLLPDFLYDYDYPPYKFGDENPWDLDFAAWDFSKFIDEDKNTKVDSDTFVDVTVCLFKDTTSDNTKVTVRVFLLDGKSASSINQRITQLLEDFKKLNKAEYTEASWNRLDVAQQTAAAIQGYSGADMEMLSNALSMLNSAMNNLDKAASTFKATLDALVKIGATYKEADYTPTSWAAFKNALDTLKELQSDKDATATRAQRAIKTFQRAQSGLLSSSLSVPATVPKTDFEKIYGEDLTRTYSGTMLDGTKYTWTFNGKDITSLSAFTPEVKNTDAVEESILIEAGSASRYRMFSTVQATAFPGKATLELDVDNYADGDYYLYKWNTAEKRSKMVGTAVVKDGKASAVLSEGGIYYISKNVRNFDLNSRRFKTDHSKKVVVLPLLGSYNVSTLRNSMDFGSYVEVKDQNGDSVSNVSILYADMTVNAPGGDKYTFKLSGDLNGDNRYGFSDVSALLTLVVNNGDLTYGDINGDGAVNMTDVSRLLEYVVSN
ncbi:MAG: hypothetical protein K2N56_06750 [Oscillospiraceae bacterium]|nr:hypothetical protein [Oscillospiraceae bacterium]